MASGNRKISFIVSLLTIQVVTVLFVVISAFLWLIPALSDESHKPRKIYIAFLPALCTLGLLGLEIHAYVSHSLTASSYLCFQGVKTGLWAFFLSSLLRLALTVDEASSPHGVRIFGEATGKLLLPFLASLALAAVWWRQDWKTRVNARAKANAGVNGRGNVDGSAVAQGRAMDREAAGGEEGGGLV